MKLAARAVMICILEDLHKEGDEAASEAAPGGRGERDMHTMITALPLLLPTPGILPCLVLSAFPPCESTSFPNLLMFKASFKKIIFVSDILWVSLFLSLILNYSWELDNISACLMKSEAYWVKFSKFASPVAMTAVSRQDRMASHQVEKGKLSVMSTN